MELKKRYTNLYIPSDFFNAKHLWSEAYPIHSPFQVQYATNFHIFPKDGVEPPSPPKWQFDPADSDYSWVAKVMLLSSPNIEELYERTCHFVDKDSKERDELVHPTRALKFLVGLKEKREIMAIGGPWSPSLDGPNPGSDPTTLIKTAVRTCGALTGIDLSNCTQWTKFLQIHYRRQLSSSKPARTETVVIFFPDVWGVMPNKLEYDSLAEQYAATCRAKQEPGKTPGTEPGEEELEKEEEEGAQGEGESTEGKAPVEPKHWQTLDPKTMKVGELRDQLEARGQLNKGLKSQLQARLQKCLKTEQEAEETKDGEGSGSMDMVTEDTEKKGDDENATKDEAGSAEEVMVVLDERQKEKLALAYKTPSSPCIFVHPNTKAKSGKFDCRTESLSVLLDYRSEDNKEGTFEVSLFAELFNEMFIRDSAFKLYKAIQGAPEKVKEDKKEKKDDVVIPVEATKEGAATAVDAESKTENDEKAGEDKREASVEMVEEKEKVMVTKNKDLLLGASYFDLSHCGYIETKDMEDILLPLELDLSRAEIKKLASKLAVKEQVNYRLLVDGEAWQDVDEPSSVSSTSLTDLALGFRKFIPSDGTIGTEAQQSEHIVKYKGSVIDVAKLQEKLDKSEKVRAATDSKLIDLQKKFALLKETNDKGEKVREKMSGDLRETRKKVRVLEEEVASTSREATRYSQVLGEVYHKVAPIVKPPKTTEVKGTETMPQVNGVEKEDDPALAASESEPANAEIVAK